MLSAPRILQVSEQQAALDLWVEVFGGTSADYFSRYYEADSDSQLGDTIGVWDGPLLVSAAHLCRRSMNWNGGTLLCGALANVATRENYRRQGVSRLLLRETIDKMERERFHFSLLGTGTHGHYATLGWEQIKRPQFLLDLRPDLQNESVSGEWQNSDSIDDFFRVYPCAPRPLQFVRSPQYFNDWSGWVWRSRSAEIYATLNGFVVVEFPKAREEAATVLEWCAEDELSEHILLKAACVEALRRGHSSLHLTAKPQFLNQSQLREWGKVNPKLEKGGMIRRLSLPESDFAAIGHAYNSGQAAWWESDGF